MTENQKLLAYIVTEIKDDEFLQFLHRTQHNVEVKQDELKTLKEDLSILEREAEMRHIAGGFENLKLFRARAHLTPEQRNALIEKLTVPEKTPSQIGTVTGRLSSSERNLSNPPRSLPRKTVHILVGGLSKCKFSRDVPSVWPPGHTWVGEDPKDSVPTEDRCADCYAPPAVTPKTFFLNEAQELPRTTKSQVRRDKKADKLQIEVTGKMAFIARSVPGCPAVLKALAAVEKLEKRIKFLRTPKVKK